MNRITSIIILVCILCFASTVFGGGQTVVPFVCYTNPDQNTHFFIRNITSHDLTISIKVYNQNGTEINGSNYGYYNFQNSNTELGAKKAGEVFINNSTSECGTAVVSWSNKGTDMDYYGLIASAVRYDANGQQDWSNFITINDGKPF